MLGICWGFVFCSIKKEQHITTHPKKGRNKRLNWSTRIQIGQGSTTLLPFQICLFWTNILRGQRKNNRYNGRIFWNSDGKSRKIVKLFDETNTVDQSILLSFCTKRIEGPRESGRIHQHIFGIVFATKICEDKNKIKLLWLIIKHVDTKTSSNY